MEDRKEQRVSRKEDKETEKCAGIVVHIASKNWRRGLNALGEGDEVQWKNCMTMIRDKKITCGACWMNVNSDEKSKSKQSRR